MSDVVDGSAAAASSPPPLRVLEFFSGVGGLHYSLRRSGVPHRVLRAYDVDDAANRTYRHNLDTAVSASDIGSIKSAELVELAADCWLLSPPCQPYTRQGPQLGEADGRSKALSHLVGLLENGEEELLPALLLLENVAGFESSGMRTRLHGALVRRGYSVRELWASPAQFGIPNQRTRYFLLASLKRELRVPAPAAIERLMLEPEALERACEAGTPLPLPRGEVDAEAQARCEPLGAFLLDVGSEELGGLAVPEHLLERYGVAMDLVGRHHRRCCCFTKNYSRYVKGAGSILCEGLEQGAEAPTDDKSLAALRPLRPRYFAPREVARLHGFPEDFAFPPSVGKKKQYELLGNSLSVYVVAELLRYLAGGAE